MEQKEYNTSGEGGGNELVVGHGPGLVHRFVNFAFHVSTAVSLSYLLVVWDGLEDTTPYNCPDLLVD